jgi:hypothetical protein
MRSNWARYILNCRLLTNQPMMTIVGISREQKPATEYKTWFVIFVTSIRVEFWAIVVV